MMHSSNPKYVQVVDSGFPNAYLNVGDGSVRVSHRGLEYFVNGGWQRYENYTTVGLNPIYEKVLDWAFEKMTKEMTLAKLAEVNPTIKSAIEKVNEAEKDLEIILSLCHDDVTQATKKS